MNPKIAQEPIQPPHPISQQSFREPSIRTPPRILAMPKRARDGGAAEKFSLGPEDRKADFETYTALYYARKAAMERYDLQLTAIADQNSVQARMIRKMVEVATPGYQAEKRKAELCARSRREAFAMVEVERLSEKSALKVLSGEVGLMKMIMHYMMPDIKPP